MTLAEAVTKVANYAYILHLTYVLGVLGFGLYTTSLSLTELFLVLIASGIDIYAIKEISSDKASVGNIVGEILSVKLVIFAISFISILAIGFFISNSTEEYIAICIAGLLLIGRGINGRWVYQGLEKMNIVAARQIITSLLLLSTMLIFVNNDTDVLLALSILATMEFLGMAWVFYYYFKEGNRFRLDFSTKVLKKTFRAAWAFGLYFLFVQLYQSVDKLMLWVMVEDYEYQNGILSSSYKVMVLFLSVGIVIQHVMYPRLSAAENERRKSNFEIFAKLSAIVAGIGYGIMIFFPEITDIILSDEYKEAKEIAFYHGFLLFTISWVVMLTLPLLAWGKQKSILIATGIGALGNILANYFLIPEYGMYGSAIASIISEALVLFIALYLFSKEKLNISPLKFLLYPVFGISVYWSASLWFYSGNNLIFVVVLATIAYLILLILTKQINMDLLNKLKES
ncbi:MAG: flippase [Candidatus Kapaibacteriales bacterium]